MTDANDDVDILRRIEDTVLNDESLARNAQVSASWTAADSEIRTFLKDRCILITGGTGFLGKILLDKLLRTCPELRGIFVLIRSKKGSTVQERVDKVLEDEVFQVLKKKQPNFRKKVIAIEGDIEQVELGLSEENKQILQSQVSVILHCAATVKFDEPLRRAIRTNVRGTLEMIKLAKGCGNLASFIHCSTAFSNCPRKQIDEQFYEAPIKPFDLLDLVENTEEEALNQMQEKILGDFPNTYTFSKAVAEDLIRTECPELPICVFRPSIVIATYREPLKGWSDNLYGPTGVTMGAGIGVLHTLHCDPDNVCDLVPVDMVVNALIACAWITAKEGVRSEGPMVYNYVSSCERPLTWRQYAEQNGTIGIQYPTVHCVWYYSLTLNKNYWMNLLYTVFLHLLPALIVDSLCFLTGKKRRMLKIYKKIWKFEGILRFFMLREWHFTNTNVKQLWKKLNPVDQELFGFDMNELDWERFFETHILGLRVYLLKDPTSTIPQAMIKWKRFKMAHNTIKYAGILFIVYLCWLVLSNLLGLIL